MVNEKVLALRLSVAHLFKKECFVCHKPIKKGANFTYHHLWYETNEAIYKDFTSQFEYYQHLTIAIRENPDRFMLLCTPHHTTVERLKRYRKDNFKRLLLAYKKTLT